MADNVLYSQGTGTTIATDDVGNVHFQKVKLDVGGDGTALQVAGSVPVFVVSGTLANITNTISVSGTVQGFTASDLPANYFPLLIGAVAEVAADSQPANLVDNEGDIVRISAGRDGAVYVKPHPPRIWHYAQEFTTQMTDYNIHSGIANLSHYINTIYWAANAAINLTIKDGVSVTSSQKFKYYAGGQGDGVALTFNPPIKMTVNTHVGVTTSAGQTNFLAVTGYTAP